jgi:hypothetical protein
VRTVSQQSGVPPLCIGRGVDPDSGQAVGPAQCASCCFLRACTLLRITGAVEDMRRLLNPNDRSYRSYNDGTPARRWKR